MPAPDIALVSLATTPGLRRADSAFADLARAAGATVDVVPVRIGAAGRLRRHPAVTDLVEALAARRGARGLRAGAIVYSAVTTGLLQPDRGPYAVRFDSPAALNRPGLAGAWQRSAERCLLERAELLLPWGRMAQDAAPPGAPSVVLPVPVDDAPEAPERDIDAAAYAGYPDKRGLDLLCAAWPGGARLVVGGIEPERARAWLRRRGVAEPDGVQWLGPLPREDWLAVVARARLFVNGSRREDHGLSQLEALAAGAALVTVPSPGAYEALPLARRLEPALVAPEVSAGALAGALRAGLALGEEALAAYRARAAEALGPYRREAVLLTMREWVLPALAGGR